MNHVRFGLLSVSIAIALFLAMLLFLEIGRRIGIRRVQARGPDARVGVGVVDGAVYAVLALFLGFAFSGATSRFDHRRELVAQEVTSIGTAWARIATLPSDLQPPVRAEFQRYVDALVTSYTAPRSAAEAERQRNAATRAKSDLWARAVAACMTAAGEKARMLLLPSLNEMFDNVEREHLARRMHPPGVIYLMLGVAALAASLFAGYAMSTAVTRNWLFTIGIAATISVMTYIIIELEYPRLGWVRVDGFDQALVELRATLN
jgi:hypothetical protein